MEQILLVLSLIVTTALGPCFLLIPIYWFYYKGLRNFFNGFANTDFMPKSRFNRYILYMLGIVPCLFLMQAIPLFLLDMNEESSIFMMFLAFPLFAGIMVFIRRRKGLPTRLALAESYYCITLLFTYVISGIALFYLGVIFLFIGLAVLIIMMCTGGVGDRVNVSSGDLLSSKEDELTKGTDGKWYGNDGTAYERNGNDFTPVS